VRSCGAEPQRDGPLRARAGAALARDLGLDHTIREDKLHRLEENIGAVEVELTPG